MRVPHHVQGPASLTHALRLTHPQKSHSLSPGRETARGTPMGSGGRVGWQRYGTHMWAWAPAACSQLEVEPLPLISLWSLRFRGRKFRSAAAPSRPASAASSPQPLPCGPSLGGGGGGSPAPVCVGAALCGAGEEGHVRPRRPGGWLLWRGPPLPARPMPQEARVCSLCKCQQLFLSETGSPNHPDRPGIPGLRSAVLAPISLAHYSQGARLVRQCVMCLTDEVTHTWWESCGGTGAPALRTQAPPGQPCHHPSPGDWRPRTPQMPQEPPVWWGPPDSLPPLPRSRHHQVPPAKASSGPPRPRSS